WHRYLWVTPLIAGKTVLDVACGEGYGAALLAQTAAAVTGIDADAATIAQTHTTYTPPNLRLIHGLAQEVPLAHTASFDAIVSFETIEHLDEEDQQRFLTEIRRVLRPDGIAIFSTPNRSLYRDRPRYENPFHLRELYLREFATMLGQSFRHVRIFGQRR